MQKIRYRLAALAAALLLAAALGGAMAGYRASAAEADWLTPADLWIVDAAEEEPNSMYLPENRQFLCSGGIEVTGNRIWSSTFSGGSTEPHLLNHGVVVYSDDGGKTWNDPFIVIDNLTHPDTVRVYEVTVWEDPGGRLWIFYCQTGDPWGSGAVSSAAFAFVIENPQAAPAEMKIEDMGMLYGGMSLNKPTVIELADGKTQWLRSAHMNWTTVTDVFASDDEGETWYKKGTAEGTACGAHETSVVQLSDGALMMTKRIDEGVGGGLEISYSADYGATWSRYEDELGAPFVNPGARTYMFKLQSGSLLLINNFHPSQRTNLTAFLSTDDGMTFPYSLVLDDRADVSYPDATQADDGTIYVCWDKGRTTYAETRLSSFTEEDVMRGSFGADGLYKVPVIKGPAYADVAAWTGESEPVVRVGLGTDLAAAAAGLPTQLNVTDSAGGSHTVRGSWSCGGYDGDTPGTYTFVFTPEAGALPANVEDVRGVLRVDVTVAETAAPAPDGSGTEDPAPDGSGTGSDPAPDEGCGGCGGTAAGVSLGLGALFAGTACAALCKKRKN